ncbi:MAG: hypothetical protein U0L51_02525 [Olegusella sp.]|nr:hypothetical protein [Olegusella sp.]
MTVTDGKTRVQVTLTDYQASELEGICKRTGAAKSTVMAIALDAFLRHKRLANEVVRLNEELGIEKDALAQACGDLAAYDRVGVLPIASLSGEDTDNLLSLVEASARRWFDAYLEADDDEEAGLRAMNCCAMIALGLRLCSEDYSRFEGWFSADAGEEGWTDKQAKLYASWVFADGDWTSIKMAARKSAGKPAD